MGYLNVVYKVRCLYDRLESITAFITCFIVSVNINWTDKLINASISITIALISAWFVQILKLTNIPEASLELLKRIFKRNDKDKKDENPPMA